MILKSSLSSLIKIRIGAIQSASPKPRLFVRAYRNSNDGPYWEGEGRLTSAIRRNFVDCKAEQL